MMLEKIIRPDLLDFKAYPENLEPSDRIALHLNESAFKRNFPMDSIGSNRYPMTVKSTTEVLAQFYGVKSDELLVTAGSDEGINLLMRLCCRPGVDSILINTPTFSMYGIYAKIQGASVIEVPLIESKDFALDVNAILKQKQECTKLIFICNPNNPTGTPVKCDDIIRLATACPEILIVIDEAYIEFSDDKSSVPLISDFSNLVILRTLSKAHAMAGIRCGTLIARSELITYLNTIASPFMLANTTLDAARFAVSITIWNQTQDEIALIRRERKRIFEICRQSKRFSKTYPSQANFLYLRCDQPNKFAECCQQQGLIIRTYPDAIRITISTPEINQRWVALC